MGIKNRFNFFVEKLSQKSFRINAFLFAIFWIIYIVASYYFTLYFAMGGWSVLATLPISILFYTSAGLAALVEVAIYCAKTNNLSFIFYPNLFINLLLVPQILYALINPFRDCGDGFTCHFTPNMLAALFENVPSVFIPIVLGSALAAALLIIAYVVGLIILFRKMFNLGNIAVSGSKKTSERIKPGILFFLIYTPVLAIVVFFASAQGGFVSKFFAYVLCPNQLKQGEESFCSWPTRQCWAIFDKNDRDNCRLGNAIDNIVKGSDASVCDKEVDDVGKRDVCYNVIARTNQDWSVCDKITTQRSKCSCFAKKAFAQKDPALCEQCNGCNDCLALTYENCYYDIAQDKQDPSVCDLIQNPASKCFCYKRIAEDLKDLSLCENCDCGEKCAFDYKYCYSDVARAKQDPSVCGIILDSYVKDDCYMSIAKIKKDVSICDSIYDKFMKNKCYKEINEQ